MITASQAVISARVLKKPDPSDTTDSTLDFWNNTSNATTMPNGTSVNLNFFQDHLLLLIIKILQLVGSVQIVCRQICDNALFPSV
jgi:hypothetical protein